MLFRRGVCAGLALLLSACAGPPSTVTAGDRAGVSAAAGTPTVPTTLATAEGGGMVGNGRGDGTGDGRIVARPFGPGETFQRFTVEDREALEKSIAETERQLADARTRGDVSTELRAVASLGNLLTTARREVAAAPLLEVALERARRESDSELTGFLLLNLATARQYLGRRDAAREMFAEGLAFAREHGLRTLEHYVLHHQGRLFVELGELSLARDAFERALAIRIELEEPRAASTRRALAALAELERKALGAAP